MTLLWFNLLLSASASAVWGMWALRASRRHAWVGAFYAFGCVGALVMAVGFLFVIMAGDPTVSAVLARWSVPLAVGAPAIARFIELLREERQRRHAMDLLDDVEARAEASEEAFRDESG